MRHTAINNMCRLHAAFYRIQRARDLRQHATVDRAVGDERIHILGGQAGQHLLVLVHHAGNVGEQNQLFSLQCLSHFACHEVGVDVVRRAIVAHAYWRDDGNEIAAEHKLEHVGLDAGHFANLTDIDFLHHTVGIFVRQRHALGADQVGVFPGETNGTTTVLVNQIDDGLIHQAAEHHFHHIHGLAVGDAHAVDELRHLADFLQQVTNLRTTAVHHHRVQANGFHQHDVTCKRMLQLRIGHGVTTVFDHDGGAVEALNIGQCFGQNLGDVKSCILRESHEISRVTE